jgi:hypothetical protein
MWVCMGWGLLGAKGSACDTGCLAVCAARLQQANRTHVRQHAASRLKFRVPLLRTLASMQGAEKLCIRV